MNADGNHVNIAKQLEEQGLTLHNRQPSLGSNVSQTENSSSIGDDGKEPVRFGVRFLLLGYLSQIFLSKDRLELMDVVKTELNLYFT